MPATHCKCERFWLSLLDMCEIAARCGTPHLHDDDVFGCWDWCSSVKSARCLYWSVALWHRVVVRLYDRNFVIDTQVAHAAVKSMTGYLENHINTMHAKFRILTTSNFYLMSNIILFHQHNASIQLLLPLLLRLLLLRYEITLLAYCRPQSTSPGFVSSQKISWKFPQIMSMNFRQTGNSSLPVGVAAVDQRAGIVCRCLAAGRSISLARGSGTSCCFPCVLFTIFVRFRKLAKAQLFGLDWRLRLVTFDFRRWFRLFFLTYPIFAVGLLCR